MSFLSVSGTRADEPSFLELIAAQRLEKGLRESFSYVLSVCTVRMHSCGARH